MKRTSRGESGQAVILVVLSLTLLLGFMGFAIDVGQLFRTREILQTAADAAAIAGAQEINYSTWKASALAAATQNGITNGANGATVTVNHPPLSGPYTGNSGYVEVIISQTQPTGFFQLINSNLMTVSARSVASNGPSHNCLYTLGTSGTDINITGLLASINVPDCGIIDNSSSGSALSETGLFDSVSAGTVTVTGGSSAGFLNSISCSASATCPVTGAAPTPDPLAYLASYDPTIPGGCTTGTTTINGNRSLTPGCWTNLTLNGGNVSFGPGLYIINGNLNINSGIGSVTGTGVTFYVTGQINFSGAQLINLSAPTSGTYNGILFFAPQSNTNTMTLTFGASLSTLNGILYLPGAPLSFTGITSTTFNSTIVVSSISFTGIGAINDYALINPATPLTGTRVVE